jgi:hypothetical protein
MLRCPSFQAEISDFLRKYPVFFLFHKRLLHGYGKAQKPLRELWDGYLRENSARLRKIEESNESILYKYVFSVDVKKSVELTEWEEKTFEFEMELQRTTRDLGIRFPKGRVLSRVDPYEDDPSGVPGLNGPPNPEYFSLARCEAGEFERAERQFVDRWGAFPHHVRPQGMPVVLIRDELERVDPNIRLFIPVSELTTKGDLEKRWGEVIQLQEIYYTKKRRPHRTHLDVLLKIYDLRCDLSPSAVAKKMGISRSAIEKHYRHVYRDIHGTGPQKRTKSQGAVVHGRRKTRLDFPFVTATYGDKESSDQALRLVFLEQGLPLAKLSALDTLSSSEKQILKAGLKARGHERQRRGF